jgi:hypothetical protein
MLTEAPSSGSASDGDVYGPSTSLDFSDQDGKKFWIRSGKQNLYMARYYDKRFKKFSEFNPLQTTSCLDLFSILVLKLSEKKKVTLCSS